MSDQWYGMRQNQRFGPLTTEQMRQLAASGQLQPTDNVWTDGMSEWTPAARVPQLFAATAVAAPGAAQVPPAAAGTPAAAAGEGGLSAALDLGFTRFLTTTIVRWLWIIHLVLAPLVYVVLVVTALFKGGLPAGAAAIFGGGALLILWTLLTRLWLETVAVLFRIAEYLRDMSQNK